MRATLAFRELGYRTVMVNSNPETVSTDFDISDVLYFEPLTLEHVLEIVHVEQPIGVVVQLGGQTPLKLAKALAAAGVPIMGTSPDAIDAAEDRRQFEALARRLDIRQPANGTADTVEAAVIAAERIGYPVLVRPSYVLGGRAMRIVYDAEELREFFDEAAQVAPGHPVLIDSFLEDAFEADVDATNVWARSLLQDDHGIAPSDVTWVRGGMETPGRPEKLKLRLPAGVRVEEAPAGATLSALLDRGEIDAFVGPRAPSCFGRNPQVGWLYADPTAAAQDYFRRTGIFPIMHVLGVRKELVQQHPWLPVALYKAFDAAKAIALERLADVSAPKASLPFVDEQVAAAPADGPRLLALRRGGESRTLEAFLAQHHAQGLSQRRVTWRSCSRRRLTKWRDLTGQP